MLSIIPSSLQEVFKTGLEQAKSIAILGAKDKAGTAVNHVGLYMVEAGYTVFPIHPVRQNVWNLPTYASLADLKEVPDIVCLFRASEACAEHAKEILSLEWRPKIFWMQEGIANAEASKLMEDAGVKVVCDACIEKVYKQLFI